MKPSTISKYHDLRYDLHRYYISPVEFKKLILEKEEALEYRAIDTVSISKEASIKYNNTYGGGRW
mgnify:CR=1 FL=1